MPFQFGKIVKEDYFINRTKELIMLKTNLLNFQSIILLSPRRWGKSSLVERAVEEIVSGNKNVRIWCLNLFNIRTE
jgi:AAA+ ATPase superfamily predicted ATPase